MREREQFYIFIEILGEWQTERHFTLISLIYAIHGDLHFFMLLVSEPPVPLLRPWWMDFIVVVTVGCTSAFLLLLILLICYKAIKRYSFHLLDLFMKCICSILSTVVYGDILHVSDGNNCYYVYIFLIRTI